SGRARRPVTVATGSAPADSASCLNSSRSSGSTCAPNPRRTSTARSPVLGRSNTQGSRAGRNHSEGSSGAAPPSSSDSRTMRAGRHDGGDGVLVDHLADAVLQQNHELVKGVDLPLQLDAVHEVDRYRNPLLTQRVEKWVLEGLAFGHDVLLIFPLRVVGQDNRD